MSPSLDTFSFSTMDVHLRRRDFLNLVIGKHYLMEDIYLSRYTVSASSRDNGAWLMRPARILAYYNIYFSSVLSLPSNHNRTPSMISAVSTSIILIGTPASIPDPKPTPASAPAAVHTYIPTFVLYPTPVPNLRMFMEPGKFDIVPSHSLPFFYTQPMYE